MLVAPSFILSRKPSWKNTFFIHKINIVELHSVNSSPGGTHVYTSYKSLNELIFYQTFYGSLSQHSIKLFFFHLFLPFKLLISSINDSYRPFCAIGNNIVGSLKHTVWIPLCLRMPAKNFSLLSLRSIDRFGKENFLFFFSQREKNVHRDMSLIFVGIIKKEQKKFLC